MFPQTSTSTIRNLPPSAVKKKTDGPPSFVVLGIDPGTLMTGYGIVARTGPGLRHIASGVIPNRAGTPIAQRLVTIYSGLVNLIGTFHPDEVAIETAFYGKNAQSALKLGHARGVSILAAVQHQIPLSEYAPREVKKAVVGNGNASKQQVAFMVRTLLQLNSVRLTHDTADALAVAICHLERSRPTSGRHQSWKSYVEAHPERVRK